MERDNDSTPMERSGWFLPWKTDSIELLEYARRRQVLTNIAVIKPAGLDAFLDDADTTVQILIGSRGSGKSLVLAMKAAANRAALQKRLFQLLSEHPHVNRLTRAEVTIPSVGLSRFTDHLTWLRTWQLLLGSAMAFVVLRAEDVPKDQPDRIDFLIRTFFRCEPSKQADRTGPYEYLYEVGVKIFSGQIEAIAPILNFMIRRNISMQTCIEWFDQHVSTALGRGPTDAIYCAYVDGIDEMLAETSGASLFPKIVNNKDTEQAAPQEPENQRVLAVECWTSAQTGFMDAVALLREKTNQRVRIYGAVRAEVLDVHRGRSNLGALKANAPRVLRLDYTPQDLEAIFNLNVAWSQDSDKANAGAQNPAEQLFGFSEIKSHTVWGGEESVIQHILRHSFGTPRHIVEVARAAKGSVTSAMRATPEGRRAIVMAINAASRDVLTEYLQAVVPLWQQSIAAGLAYIPRNVLTKAEAAEAEWKFSGLPEDKRTTFEKTENWRLFPFLYSRGLLGMPANVGGKYVLSFLRPDGKEAAIPDKVAYVALHPALAEEVCCLPNAPQRDAFYIGEFIVGAGLPCPERLDSKTITVNLRAAGDFVIEFRGQTCSPGGDGHASIQDLVTIAAVVLAIRRTKRIVVDLDTVMREVDALLQFVPRPSPRPRKHRKPVSVPKPAVSDVHPAQQQIRNALNYTAVSEQPRLVRRVKQRLESFGLDWKFQKGPSPSFGLVWQTATADRPGVVTSEEIAVRIV